MILVSKAHIGFLNHWLGKIIFTSQLLSSNSHQWDSLLKRNLYSLTRNEQQCISIAFNLIYHITDVYRRRLMYTRGVDTKIGSFWPKNSTHPFSFLISSPIFFLSFLVKGTNWKYRVRDWTSISCECRNFLCQLRAYKWVVYDRRQWTGWNFLKKKLTTQPNFDK